MSKSVEFFVYEYAERANSARFIMLSIMTKTESLLAQEAEEKLSQSQDLITPAPGSNRAARFMDMFCKTGK